MNYKKYWVCDEKKSKRRERQVRREKIIINKVALKKFVSNFKQSGTKRFFTVWNPMFLNRVEFKKSVERV